MFQSIVVLKKQALMQIIQFKGFPPVSIPLDGTPIGIDQLKNIIDISVEARRRHEQHAQLNKGVWKRFKGWLLGAWWGGNLLEVFSVVDVLWEEVKDLDVFEINELVQFIANKHNLDKEAANKFILLLRQLLEAAKDGKFTLKELQEITF